MRRSWVAEAALLVLLAVAGSLAAVATFLRVPPPPPSAPPPFYITEPRVVAYGPHLVISFDVTSCRVEPYEVVVEVVALNRSEVISEAAAGSGCGSFEVELPAAPYEVLHPAVYVVNASLPRRSYVVGFFVEAANVTYSVEFANISYVNGTPFVTVRYTSPLEARLGVRELYVIDDANSALVVADCNSTSAALAPPAANGTATLPLACIYVNPAEFGRHVYFDFRGTVVATYITPEGNFTREVGLVETVWH